MWIKGQCLPIPHLLTLAHVAEGTFDPVKPAAGQSWPAGGSVGSGWGDSHKASLPEPEHFPAHLSLITGGDREPAAQFIIFLTCACFLSDLGKLLNLSVPRGFHMQTRGNCTHHRIK